MFLILNVILHLFLVFVFCILLKFIFLFSVCPFKIMTKRGGDDELDDGLSSKHFKCDVDIADTTNSNTNNNNEK